VYRGVTAYCTACGAPRVPLTSNSVTLAGQPSKVGGTITRVLGWTVLAGGLVLSALLVGLLAILTAPASAMLAVGGPIAAVSCLVAYLLLRGGKQLQRSGDDAELATKNQAIFALANTRGNVLRALDVAQSLQVSAAEGDELLTKLAKANPDQVSVDIDDDGNVLYRFVRQRSERVDASPTLAPNAPAPVRFSGAAAPARVRVPSGANASATSAYGARGVRVDARDPLELDEEEPSAAVPAQQRAR
jgi:hypothetical protein